jgi:hypothetical protein
VSESKDELIAQRDALIEQLQGEWAVDVDKRSMNRKAMLAAIISMAGMTVFFAVIVPVLILTHSEPDQSPEWSVVEMLLFFGGCNLIVGAVFYVYIWGHAFWYGRLNPIVIDENRLVWNKRKGFVPERLDLLNVTSVSRYDGTGSSKLFMNVINRLERGSSTSLSPVMFGSMGEHNTPKIIPAMFKDGRRFINAIEQIAEINTQLKQLDESDSA